ncbi:phosphate acetyltransferase [Amphritea balenae]|uniref:Phosphate acetyltransferase n=1 Tax=Amphritea balenae TaxID=452629 RepID=A0A3P1SVR6_9GAMM|nr:phosphate acetyltransferase [Amphritea balenae]RRD01302.1 phosphate acetyltransferase [Amphritea balenae]GGK58329.1 phosphate acetyltransferase [Amphritea balenae]
MSQALLLAPTGVGAGLTTAVLGLFQAMNRKGIKVHFFKPIDQGKNGSSDSSVAMLQNDCATPVAEPLPIRDAEHLVSQGKGDELLEQIVARYEQSLPDDIEVVIIEGMVHTESQPYATRINKEIAKALDAQVVLVASPGNDSIQALQDHIDITARAYGGVRSKKLLGCIISKLGAPVDRDGHMQPFLGAGNAVTHSLTAEVIREHATIFNNNFRLLGCIPWNRDLIIPRVKDIADYLSASVINTGDMDNRRVTRITMCARTVANAVNEFRPGTLVFTPGDRDDMIVAACMAAVNGVELAALVLTGGFMPSAAVLKLCAGACKAGLPILSVHQDSWQTAIAMSQLSQETRADDLPRIRDIKEATAAHIDRDWLSTLVDNNYQRRLSPPAFRYQLIKRARQADKLIVLPEGNEPRTVKAAAICAERGIARCVLLGNTKEIIQIAKNQGVLLNDNVIIRDPELVRADYIPRMVELRQHKGMTDIIAEEQLQDNVVLATLMLEMDHVDGLVSGAVHTTANTIRPPLQLIKTAPGSNLVSSVFFMCLPDQVLVYGDCAINPDPNAEQLADIAIQSADSASAFGIPPRVAMISYSTGGSGQGADVDKVREATRIAKEKRPDLLIDGPLQYDAAVMESVALSKAPGSSVAGQATVFVFPDLNTGNTTYKAVQRSADVISIGPMLQGMRKPVNDLSRGALVDDIVFTIALTAIQAGATTSS